MTSSDQNTERSISSIKEINTYNRKGIRELAALKKGSQEGNKVRGSGLMMCYYQRFKVALGREIEG
jgi:hypothetical protein